MWITMAGLVDNPVDNFIHRPGDNPVDNLVDNLRGYPWEWLEAGILRFGIRRVPCARIVV